MNLSTWKLSTLASALILGVPMTTYADDEDRYERYSFYYDASEYESEEDERDEEDEEDEEDERDEEDEEDERDEDDEDNDGSYNVDREIVLPTSYTVNAGRLLGSQCAQCHGTNGISVNSWDSIAGESNLADEIYEDDEPIMMAQAHGYTDEEIILIGEWLKTLKEND